MAIITDESGEAIWDENLEPITDGAAEPGTFLSGGTVITPLRVETTFTLMRVETTFDARSVA